MLTIDDLDSAVRGKKSIQTWNTASPKFKHTRCLEYKVTSMEELVGTASGPLDLLQYYPRWAAGLADCQAGYPIDKKTADQLQEALATSMEQVLGEETSSYLTTERLNNPVRNQKWLEEWRTFAIIGVGSVWDSLQKEP